MFLAYLPNVVDYITYKHEQLALSFIHLYLYGYDVNDNMFVIRLLFMKLQYSLLKVFKRSSRHYLIHFMKLCVFILIEYKNIQCMGYISFWFYG